jgi:hypothetical protein
MTAEKGQPAPPRSSGRGFRVLSIVLGVLLLATAGLKIHGLYTDPYAQESILLTPRLLVAVIEVEILLGLWLLSGLAMRAAWLAALAFFAAGASANVYLAVEGQRSCGCFGRVEVNPWATLGIDVTATLALLLCRPPPLSVLPSPQAKAYLFKTALAAGAAVVLIGGRVFFGMTILMQRSRSCVARRSLWNQTPLMSARGRLGRNVPSASS